MKGIYFCEAPRPSRQDGRCTAGPFGRGCSLEHIKWASRHGATIDCVPLHPAYPALAGRWHLPAKSFSVFRMRDRGIPTSLLQPWRKIRIGAAVFVAGSLGMGLIIPGNPLMVHQSDEVKKTPSYAGFAGIQTVKNHFILFGDTQRASHWEFWREKNDKQRKLIIDEIRRREPVLTHSSSKKLKDKEAIW